MSQRSTPAGGRIDDPAGRVPGYSDSDTERRVAERAKSAGLAAIGPAGRRSPFDRDRARVLHSASFRRLAGKTQVVAPDEAEVPRTRLTHSLEVAQIARDIGAQLGTDPDLADLAGLAHDIGHPPFGHNGEKVLNRIGAAAGGFEANAQNLRLLTRLEPKVVAPDGNPAGLNLTRASLDAVIKYPWPRSAAGGKFGVFEPELEVFGWIRAGAPAGRRSLESQVMDWADDVAYSVHDVEDGVLTGRIALASLNDPEQRDEIARAAAAPAGDREWYRAVLDDLLALPVVAAGLVAADGRTRVAAAALKSVTSELTGRFVTAAVAATRYEHGPDPVSRYRADLVVPELVQAEVALLKAVAARYVMQDPHRRAVQDHEQQVLTELVRVCCERGAPALDRPFADDYRAAGSDIERLRVVLDQVSLLTDAQAVSWYRALAG